MSRTGNWEKDKLLQTKYKPNIHEDIRERTR